MSVLLLLLGLLNRYRNNHKNLMVPVAKALWSVLTLHSVKVFENVYRLDKYQVVTDIENVRVVYAPPDYDSIFTASSHGYPLPRRHP